MSNSMSLHLLPKWRSKVAIHPGTLIFALEVNHPNVPMQGTICFVLNLGTLGTLPLANVLVLHSNVIAQLAPAIKPHKLVFKL